MPRSYGKSRPSISSIPTPVRDMTAVAPTPVADQEAARLIAACGPFEAAPEVAVAVSGGADSMALTLLVDAWARSQGGRVTALTVDHGLRPEAAAEAAQVKAWLTARGIAHETLRWEGDKPKTGIQAAARRARYELLLGWCRQHDVIHLFLAHHADDQAETVAMRQAKGSGPEGLAAMALISPPPVPGPRWPRLVRPLLPVRKERLEATLRAKRQPWIDDPSNLDLKFERVRIRRRLCAEPEAVERFVALAAAHAETRAKGDRELAGWLAQTVTLTAEGAVSVDRAVADQVPDHLRQAFWRRILMTVGGHTLPPRREKIARLAAAVRDPSFRGATAAGCRVAAKPNHFLVQREKAVRRPQAAPALAF